MVYCTKCSTLNSDSTTVCSKCGAPLIAGQAETGPQWRHRRYSGEYYEHTRRGGGIAALIIGIIIIFVGLVFLVEPTYNISLPWWPIIIIIVDVWLLLRAVLWRRRY
jgi:hypothetical protein